MVAVQRDQKWEWEGSPDSKLGLRGMSSVDVVICFATPERKT